MTIIPFSPHLYFQWFIASTKSAFLRYCSATPCNEYRGLLGMVVTGLQYNGSCVEPVHGKPAEPPWRSRELRTQKQQLTAFHQNWMDDH